jgi:peptidoglycan L-alanyl-D-glutamate endopeptidase CwlK
MAMAFKFGVRSKSNLSGVKPKLRALMEEAITDSPLDFVVTCGLRTIDEQRVLVSMGKSQTMKSKHLTGDAVDIAVFVDGKITWEHKHYRTVAAHIKKIANKQGTAITWGGDWKTFIDSPHFQLGA